jgi:GNAT superfamily N-acetyltransferase
MHMGTLSIRALRAQDDAAAAKLFADVIGGRLQARLGETHDVVSLPGVAAWAAEELVGLATYRIGGERSELAAFAVADGRRHGGTGTALLDALCTTLAERGVRELWLVTTNDTSTRCASTSGAASSWRSSTLAVSTKPGA